MEDNCDICGMRFQRSALRPINGLRWCAFCVEENTNEAPKRDTWPSPAPTEVNP
jgi:hypothetical protein